MIDYARHCNMCGQLFDDWDEQEDFGFTHRVGYGSKFDLQVLRCDFCCNCFDKLMDEYILPRCKISPIVGEYE